MVDNSDVHFATGMAETIVAVWKGTRKIYVSDCLNEYLRAANMTAKKMERKKVLALVQIVVLVMAPRKVVAKVLRQEPLLVFLLAMPGVVKMVDMWVGTKGDMTVSCLYKKKDKRLKIRPFSMMVL